MDMTTPRQGEAHKCLANAWRKLEDNGPNHKDKLEKNELNAS